MLAVFQAPCAYGVAQIWTHQCHLRLSQEGTLLGTNQGQLSQSSIAAAQKSADIASWGFWCPRELGAPGSSQLDLHPSLYIRSQRSEINSVFGLNKLGHMKNASSM